MTHDILFPWDRVDVRTRVSNALENINEVDGLYWYGASLYFGVPEEVFEEVTRYGWDSSDATKSLRQLLLTFLRGLDKDIDLKVWL